MFERSLGQHWQGNELAEERRMVLQLASTTAPDADRDLLVVWASVFGTRRTGRGAKLVLCKQSPQGTSDGSRGCMHRPAFCRGSFPEKKSPV